MLRGTVYAALAVLLAGGVPLSGARAASADASMTMPATGNPEDASNTACTTAAPIADDVLGKLSGNILPLVGKSLGDAAAVTTEPRRAREYLAGILTSPTIGPHANCSSLCVVVPYYVPLKLQTCISDSDGSNKTCFPGEGKGANFSTGDTTLSVGRGDARVVCSMGRSWSQDYDKTFSIHAAW